MWPQESLTSVRLRGEWHAIYPSGERTLCLLIVNAAGHRRPPTCSTCVAAAKELDKIDGSIPEHWRSEITTGELQVARRYTAARATRPGQRRGS